MSFLNITVGFRMLNVNDFGNILERKLREKHTIKPTSQTTKCNQNISTSLYAKNTDKLDNTISPLEY
jgi:hypothetical protein